MLARTVEKGGRGGGGKRSRVRKYFAPNNFVIAIHLCSAFLWHFICFKRVFARTVYFDDSFNVRNQSVVLIFLIYRNWFYPSKSVVGVIGSMSFCSHSIFSAFESLFPLARTRHYQHKTMSLIHKYDFLHCFYTECLRNFLE